MRRWEGDKLYAASAHSKNLLAPQQDCFLTSMVTVVIPAVSLRTRHCGTASSIWPWTQLYVRKFKMQNSPQQVSFQDQLSEAFIFSYMMPMGSRQHKQERKESWRTGKGSLGNGSLQRKRDEERENHAEKLPAISLKNGCCSATALTLTQAGNAVTARWRNLSSSRQILEKNPSQYFVPF